MDDVMWGLTLMQILFGLPEMIIALYQLRTISEPKRGEKVDLQKKRRKKSFAMDINVRVEVQDR